MSKKLRELIVTTPPREKSGARSSSRFDFQKNWVVSLILKFYLNDRKFLIVCDYHDDVVIFDDNIDPSEATFYQIKTKGSGHWTLNSLLSRRKGKNDARLNSILGKLYANYISFDNHTESLNFVSNSGYKFKLATGKLSLSLHEIECCNLANGEIKNLKKKITEECKYDCTLPVNPPLFFKVTPLSVSDHSAHTKGKVADFLESILPGKKHPVTAFYRVLFDEVKRKTNYEYSPVDFDDLKNRKGISHEDMKKYMSSLQTDTDIDELWQEIREYLVKENLPAMMVRKIKSSWDKYEIDRMDHSNDILQNLRREIIGISKNYLSRVPNSQLVPLMEFALKELSQQVLFYNFSIDYIKAIILLETYETAK